MILQHTWVTKLLGYDLSVKYRLGKLNTVADALSRRDEDSDTMATRPLSGPSLALYDDLCAAVQRDPQAQEL